MIGYGIGGFDEEAAEGVNGGAEEAFGEAVGRFPGGGVEGLANLLFGALAQKCAENERQAGEAVAGKAPFQPLELAEYGFQDLGAAD